jgi:uncharacterized protein YndB with AHSA1/START domain
MTAVNTEAPTAINVTADTTKGIINGTADINASPERIFRALTTEEQSEWWGQGEYRTHDYVIDLRPGGRWSCKATSPKGDTSTVGGEYITIDPPKVLEYTWEPSWDNFAKSRVRIELEPRGSGTRLTLVHDGFEGREQMTENHKIGWTRVLGWLSGYVAGK